MNQGTRRVLLMKKEKTKAKKSPAIVSLNSEF
jgi:hypothetical protein